VLVDAGFFIRFGDSCAVGIGCIGVLGIGIRDGKGKGGMEDMGR
jgi:hypothetical protein